MSKSNHNNSPQNVNPFSGIDYETPPPDPRWPTPMRQEAYYGLAGEFVSLTLPHTEGDPVALLTQFLISFGNIIGRSAYFQVEETYHYSRDNVVIVGDSAKSRKGTSKDHVDKRFEIADPQWFKECMVSGLGSGEALIYQVRDDPHITDKRRLVTETEFASILKVSNRKDNILSMVIRNSWDDKSLRNITKGSNIQATNSHMSIIGHITQYELSQNLKKGDMANGFGNRFLWICVRRSKLLPQGGQIRTVDFTDFDRRLLEAINYTKALAGGLEKGCEVSRDKEAADFWESHYPTLSQAKPGILGALTSRSEPHVVRLSLIYALLDKSPVINLQHLKAALAVWDYAEDSVSYIFGKKIGNKGADKILEALRNAPRGLTRSGISKLFQGNYDVIQIDTAINILKSQGLILEEKSSTQGTGRPTTTYKVV